MSNTPSFIDHNRSSSYDSQFLRMIAEKHYLTGAGKYTPEGERIMEIADKIDMVTGEEMRRNEQQAAFNAALDRIAELDKEMGL